MYGIFRASFLKANICTSKIVLHPTCRQVYVEFLFIFRNPNHQRISGTTWWTCCLPMCSSVACIMAPTGTAPASQLWLVTGPSAKSMLIKQCTLSTFCDFALPKVHEFWLTDKFDYLSRNLLKAVMCCPKTQFVVAPVRPYNSAWPM